MFSFLFMCNKNNILKYDIKFQHEVETMLLHTTTAYELIAQTLATAVGDHRFTKDLASIKKQRLSVLYYERGGGDFGPN